MRNPSIIIFFLFGLFSIQAQTLTATFPSMAGELVRFGTFQGIQSKTLDSVRVDSNGVIEFNFNTDKLSIGFSKAS
jgi:hypothetical protein